MKRQWKMHQWKTLPVALGLLLCGGCNGEAGVEIEETRHPDGTKTTVPFSGSGPSYQLETEISLLKSRAEDNGFSYEVNRTYTDLMVHTAEQ